MRSIARRTSWMLVNFVDGICIWSVFVLWFRWLDYEEPLIDYNAAVVECRMSVSESFRWQLDVTRLSQGISASWLIFLVNPIRPMKVWSFRCERRIVDNLVRLCWWNGSCLSNFSREGIRFVSCWIWWIVFCSPEDSIRQFVGIESLCYWFTRFLSDCFSDFAVWICSKALNISP